jgi:hypothetical protein
VVDFGGDLEALDKESLNHKAPAHPQSSHEIDDLIRLQINFPIRKVQNALKKKPWKLPLDHKAPQSTRKPARDRQSDKSLA